MNGHQYHHWPIAILQKSWYSLHHGIREVFYNPLRGGKRCLQSHIIRGKRTGLEDNGFFFWIVVLLILANETLAIQLMQGCEKLVVSQMALPVFIVFRFAMGVIHKWQNSSVVFYLTFKSFFFISFKYSTCISAPPSLCFLSFSLRHFFKNNFFVWCLLYLPEAGISWFCAWK